MALFMNIFNLRKIELEITNDCNAACPGCARTKQASEMKITSFGLEDIKRLFPTKESIDKKIFKFCGVLGDPAMNIECLDMVKYLVENGAWCQLSTNGGVQKAEWWRELGELSARTNSVDVSFCVDGHKETNHIYRVNTKFDTIARNMQAYSEGGEGKASATWMFIVFDHNEYELDVAKTHATELGFKFATRTGMRNSYADWVSVTKTRNIETKKLEDSVKVITTTGDKEHKAKEEVLEIDKAITNFKKLTTIPNKTQETTVAIQRVQELSKTITCKLIHEGEIFISADKKMWPCCFLWDSSFVNKEKINDKLAEYGGDWNDLSVHSIDEILQHPWFDKILADSWDPTHDKHLTRCLKTCGLNKAYHNKINYS